MDKNLDMSNEKKKKKIDMSNDTYAPLSWPLTHIVRKAETILTIKVTMNDNYKHLRYFSTQ